MSLDVFGAILVALAALVIFFGYVWPPGIALVIAGFAILYVVERQSGGDLK